MTQEEKLMMRVSKWGTKLIRMVFSRWRFLTLYLVFAGMALNGWYIDIVGWFSNSDNYAATIRAQYGDINILNVITFLIGSLVFVIYLWADVKHKRLEKMIVGDVNVKNSSVFGDTTQTISTGDNSQSINNQGNVTINNFTNITAERFGELFDEKLPIALKNYSIESYVVAQGRAIKFRSKLIPRMGEEENGYESFADPAFQALLIEAQKVAVTTEREADYDVLSEMLANRNKMTADRSLLLAVNKAVSILPYLSDAQLAGITVEFCLAIVSPQSNEIDEILEKIDKSYGHVIGDIELPKGDGWLESLEAGGLIKNVKSPHNAFKKSKEIILKNWSRFTITGIKKGSANYDEAIRILRGNNLEGIIVEHELNDKYVRLYPMDIQSIDNVFLRKETKNGDKEDIMFSESQKEALKTVFGLYDNDQKVKEDFQNRFYAKYNEYPNMKKVNEWWDSIPTFYQLTVVGRVLASVNAHRCDSFIPLIVS
jgi:hypothetical protein